MSAPIVGVGRTVHYVSHGTPVLGDGSQAFASQCRFALVTEIDSDDPSRVGLCAVNPTGLFFHPLGLGGSRHAGLVGADGEPGYLGGTWHFPEFCAPAIDEPPIDGSTVMTMVGRDADGDRPYWCATCVAVRYSRRGGDRPPDRCQAEHPGSVYALYIRASSS